MAFVAAVVFSFSQAESQLFFPSHVFGFLHFQQMQPRVRWEWRLPFVWGRKVQVMWEAPLAAVVGRQRGGGEPLPNTLYHILRGAQICSYHKSPDVGVNRRCSAGGGRHTCSQIACYTSPPPSQNHAKGQYFRSSDPYLDSHFYDRFISLLAFLDSWCVCTWWPTTWNCLVATQRPCR
jgi:hypothetical protein